MRRLTRGLLAALLLTVSLLVLSSASVQAVDVLSNNQGPCSGASGSGQLPSFCSDQTTTDPLLGANGILTKVIQVIALLVGVIAVIMLIVSGIRLAASGGNDQSVKTARSGVIYALIGVAVAVAAQAIVTFVIGKV